MASPKLLKPDVVQIVPIDRLFVDPENDELRTITPTRFEDLLQNLLARPSMLAARPPIANLEGGIIAGAHRWKASQKILTDTDIPWGDFHEMWHGKGIPVFARAFPTDAERREWMLADNAEFATYVPDALAGLVAQHAADPMGSVQLLGLADADVRRLLDAHAHAAAGDPGPDPGGQQQVPASPTFGRNVTCPECGCRFHTN